MSLRTSQLVSAPMLAVGLLGFALWSGCSASTDEDDTSGGFGASSASTTGEGGSGGQGGGGIGGATITVGVGGGSGIGGGDVCDETEALAKQKQLDVIVLQDRSGSMDDGIRWPGSVNALKTFANDPASAGINLGIVYFPAVNGSSECNVPDYKEVLAFGTLPQSAPMFVQSLDTTEPGGGTPMSAGMEGVLFAATAMQDQNPDHKVIVVLASDGEPGGCPNDNAAFIAGLAESAYNYNGVQTYGIFIAGNKNTLDLITTAGGTGPSFDVSADIQAFAEKMAEIRADAIGCEITIPPPPQGEEFDKDLINVKYTPGGQGMPNTLLKKDSKVDCGAGAGWYYDDEQNPTKIIFCPASCQTVQADIDAKINVAFGCLSDRG